MSERDLKAILGQNIKKLRGYRKLSQEDLAEKVDISVPFMSEIETGKKWASLVTLAKMADALNIEAYELLKPSTIIPDNAVNILEKYTQDIYHEFGNTIHNIHKNYLQQMNGKMKSGRK